MKRFLVCSDIHGQYDEFIELLEKAQYNGQEDQLILLGDYIDRGPKSRQVMEKVIDLVEKDGAIALKGNHDQMMINFCDQNEGNDLENHYWIHINGGMETLKSYIIQSDVNAGASANENANAGVSASAAYEGMRSHASWMKENLKLYHEEDRYIFVHAGIAPNIPLDKQSEDDLLWIRHNDLCGLGKTIVHGHTSVAEVCYIQDQLFIDTGSVTGGKLTMIELPGGGLFQV